MKGQSKGMAKPAMNKKPMGITKILAMLALQGGKEGMLAAHRRAELLVNGYRNPMPGNHTNQRKRRKLARQTGIFQ